MNQNRTFSAAQAIQSSEKQVLLVDTDIGDDIDDALALALVLNSPELELRAVTTVFGDTRKRALLASHLLQGYNRPDIPVAAGIGTPLLSRHAPSGVPQAAVLDTVKEVPTISTLSGPELIIQTAQAFPGQLTLLCIGPLTNIAAALIVEPRLFLSIRRIVMMGGTTNIPFAEWNVRSDARAAQIVLGAGIPITMIGWNVTTRCRMREEDVETIHMSRVPQVKLLSDLLAIWQQHHPWWHPAEPFLHDPLAAATLCFPELVKFEDMTVRVLTQRLLRGVMLPRVDGPLVHAAIDVDADKARAWMMNRLLAPPLQRKSS